MYCFLNFENGEPSWCPSHASAGSVDRYRRYIFQTLLTIHFSFDNHDFQHLLLVNFIRTIMAPSAANEDMQCKAVLEKALKIKPVKLFTLCASTFCHTNAIYRTSNLCTMCANFSIKGPIRLLILGYYCRRIFVMCKHENRWLPDRSKCTFKLNSSTQLTRFGARNIVLNPPESGAVSDPTI